MNGHLVKSIQVPVPPLHEQRAIAAALSDVDALISGLDKLIAKKRAVKTAAMQQLLTGKQRLPRFSGEWEVKRLQEVCSISVGESKSKYIDSGGRYLIIDMGSVSTIGKLIATKRTDYMGDFLSLGDLVMPKDDIGGGNIIGKVAYIDEDNRYVLGDHVYVLKARLGSPLFLSYAINGHVINSALRKKVSGSAQLGLGKKSVEDQEIRFPSPEEQTAIAAVLSDMDAEVAALEGRREKTRQIKQAMMQELLTGRTRLVSASIEELKPVKQGQTEKPGHNQAFNEAVVIAALADRFATNQYPIGRKRYTKLSYLLYRHTDGNTQGYLKKPAGPYNPGTRYKGAESIAQKNGYVRSIQSGKFSGFVTDQKIDQALTYFEKWYRRYMKSTIPGLIEKWQPIIGVQVDDWGVKKMKTRWGSCNIRDRRVWLNLELAKKPPHCLEYVLVHEMVHLLERHHNERFKAFMDQFMPQWRMYQDELNQAPLAYEEWVY